MRLTKRVVEMVGRGSVGRKEVKDVWSNESVWIDEVQVLRY